MLRRSRLQQILVGLVVLCLFVAMFWWMPSLYRAFWWRRASLFVAGGLSLLYLVAFAPAILRRYPWRWLGSLAGLSTALLLIRSPIVDGLVGRPLVHPSVGSLLASISISLFLAVLPRRQVLIGFYFGVLWWAMVCLLFWWSDTPRGRLGFIDSQVIYAAYLFMVGVIVGTWLQARNQVDKWVGWCGVGFLLLCLLLTQTRSALTIVGVYLVWFYWAKLRAWPQLLAVAVVAGLILLTNASSLSRLKSMSYFSQSIGYRSHLVQASFSTRPADLLIGGGVGSIEKNITDHMLRYPDLSKDVAKAVRFESSHNYLGDLIVERGLIVAFLFALIVVQALWARSDHRSPARVVLIATVAFLLVNNINLQMELVLWTTIIWQLGSLTMSIKFTHTVDNSKKKTKASTLVG